MVRGVAMLPVSTLRLEGWYAVPLTLWFSLAYRARYLLTQAGAAVGHEDHNARMSLVRSHTAESRTGSRRLVAAAVTTTNTPSGRTTSRCAEETDRATVTPSTRTVNPPVVTAFPVRPVVASGAYRRS